MLGIGELALLVLVLLFAGGAVSRLARWALFRRAPGAKRALSVLLDWIEDRRSAEGETEEPPPIAKGP
jgi:hypothetical protein